MLMFALNCHRNDKYTNIILACINIFLNEFKDLCSEKKFIFTILKGNNLWHNEYVVILKDLILYMHTCTYFIYLLRYHGSVQCFTSSPQTHQFEDILD